MTITEPVYATRENVKRALDIKQSALVDDQIDRLLQAASRSVEGDLKRRFHPRRATVRWDWPSSGSTVPWRLWLDDDELISVTSLSSGGTSIPPTDYTLYPDTGPPYNRLEITLSGGSAFAPGSTHQKSILVTGLFGHSADTQSVGTLTAELSSSATSATVSNGSTIGVGDLLVIGSEYLLVTGRSWVSSAQTLQTPLTDSSANTALVVTSGVAFNVGEALLLDTERFLVTDVIGNTLHVRRAWEGTVLAAHTGSTVHVNRGLTVARGQVGSTAASAPNGAAVSRWTPPSLVSQLCVAETVAAIEQEQSGYARVVGSGESAFEARGIGLGDLRDRAVARYGRKNRTRAV